MFSIPIARSLILRFCTFAVFVIVPLGVDAQSELNHRQQPSVKNSRRESPAARRLRASLQRRKRTNSAASGPLATPPVSNVETKVGIAANQTTVRLASRLPQESSLNPTPTADSEPTLKNEASLVATVGISDGNVNATGPVQRLEFASPESSNDPTANPYSLASLLEMAVANHPTLGAATAGIDAARYEAFQAGLGPNPQLGFFMDEVGNDDDPGLIGFYIQRNIIRGNKLALSSQVKSKEAIVLENKLQTLAIRIETDVRTAFYKLLIAQKKNELSQQLFASQRESVEQAERLYESGETPKTDLLQTKLQAQKTLIMVSQTEVEVQNAWRQLAVVTGDPKLPFGQINGSLNEVFETVSFEECQQHIFALSPELKTAQAEINRVQATVAREQAQQIPNYQTQVRVGKDSTTEHFFAGVQLQVPMMIYNRNQGNIAAAKSRLLEASHNLEKIKLQLSHRLAKQYGQYQAALMKTNLYNSKLIPQAQESLELLMLGYPEEVEVFQILTAQQLIVEFTFEYLDSLNDLWVSRSKIEGLLLEESLSN